MQGHSAAQSQFFMKVKGSDGDAQGTYVPPCAIADPIRKRPQMLLSLGHQTQSRAALHAHRS